MNITKKLAAKCAIASAAVFGVAPDATAQTEKEKLQAYAQSDYQFCDAKKIAAVWKTDVGGGKIVIGGKILSGLTHLADSDISSTGASVPCEWREIGFSYDDAVKLAEFWGESVADAKSKATRYSTERGARQFRLDMAHVLG